MPFDVKDGKVAEVEQDTVEDVAGCVFAILLTPVGYRDEAPDFGTADPTFTAPVNTERLRRTVAKQEERANSTVEENVDAFEAGVRRLRFNIPG